MLLISISKVTFVICISTQNISPSVNNFYVLAPKEVDSCKDLVEISYPCKQITSPLLPKSKAFVVANLAIKKKFKLVDQVGKKQMVAIMIKMALVMLQWNT